MKSAHCLAPEPGAVVRSSIWPAFARGAHMALGDVQTVADLMAQVLRPIAGHRDLDTWKKLVAFAAEEWFPSRIAFGKHKGRLIQEARKDAELRGLLDWLAKSANARNAKMGRWYLRRDKPLICANPR